MDKKRCMKVDSKRKIINSAPIDVEGVIVQKSAFTLAEVIITLIVIGVVAAITVPMLYNNADNKKWAVGAQKAKSTIGEAFKLMTVNGEINQNLTTAEFVEKVVPHYLKLAKTCTIENAKNCGMSTATNFYKKPDGTRVTLPTTWANSTNPQIVINPPVRADYDGDRRMGTWNYSAQNNSYFFKTIDGFSVNFFYNPYCISDNKEKYLAKEIISTGFYIYRDMAMDAVCLMGVYDMNGTKGPNKVGMDVGFIGSFYNSYEVRSSVTLPHNTIEIPLSSKLSNKTVKGAIDYCNNIDKNNNWVLPDGDETLLIYLNKTLAGGSCSGFRWLLSRTLYNGTDIYKGVYY